MKERYIKMRNDRVVDWVFIYDYVISKGFTGSVHDFNASAQHLMMSIISIMDFLDHEYNLTLVCDQQGNFIKVIT
jgi:hypothetical protein